MYFVLFQNFIRSKSYDSFDVNIYFSYISLLCNIYFVFVSIISKQWIIWFFNIFFKSLHVQAMASSSNCRTNQSHTRANHAMK